MSGGNESFLIVCPLTLLLGAAGKYLCERFLSEHDKADKDRDAKVVQQLKERRALRILDGIRGVPMSFGALGGTKAKGTIRVETDGNCRVRLHDQPLDLSHG
jgi:hypothetical protein